MKLIVAVALMGMIAVAAAVDAEIQKKHYDEEEYKGDSYKGADYHGDYHHKANVKATHKAFKLQESSGKTHPCNRLYEILGSTVTFSSKLNTLTSSDVVGGAYWSGIVTHQEECAHCGKTDTHVVRVNYEVIFDITSGHPGQLIGMVNSNSVYATDPVTIAIVGGTGAYQGAWGTVTWTSGNPSTYEFSIWLPKVLDSDYYSGSEYKYEDAKYFA